MPKKISIAITPGSERGVGPELILQALTYQHPSRHDFFWCGDQASLELASERSGCELKFLSNHQALLSSGLLISYAPLIAGDDCLKRQAGFLHKSLELALAGAVQALVTGPIEKEALAFLGSNLAGQTEYFAQHLGIAGQMAIMTFMGGPFIMSLASTHVPLKQVSQQINTKDLLSHIITLSQQLSLILKKDRSELSITVLGLNPHAGEHGLIGREEIEIISPAIKQAQALGLTIDGPLPADGYFAYWHRQSKLPDAIIALYHDQGLIAYKLLSQGRAVNVTLGLSVPRTSPAHGTAAHLIGSGQACIKSSLMAIEQAIRLA